MNTTRINKLIEALKAEGLETLTQGIETEMGGTLSREMSRAGENRMIQLIIMISKGFEKAGRKSINWELMRVVASRFVKLAEGKNKDQIKNLFTSFTLVPAFNHQGAQWQGRKYKGLNSNSKDREIWGKEAHIGKYLAGVTAEQYSNYLNILKAAKRKSRK